MGITAKYSFLQSGRSQRGIVAIGMSVGVIIGCFGESGVFWDAEVQGVRAEIES